MRGAGDRDPDDLRRGSKALNVDLIFKIAAIGVLVAVVQQVLSRAGREDIATVVTIAGLVIVLMMVVGVISDLFLSVRTLFGAYG